MTNLPAPPSLWRHSDFRWLWAGESVSQLGTFVGNLAIPFLAVTVLHADQFAMGVLTTLTTIGFLVVGLPAGAIVDRHSKRRIMIGADIGRAALLMVLPMAAWTGRLNMTVVLTVATLVGILTVFFDVAYQSYLPFLVQPGQVVKGNAKLQASESVAQMAGPAAAGLRRLIACTALGNLFNSMIIALSVLYMIRYLHLSALTLGLVEAAMAVGGLTGALLATRISRWAGEGGSIAWCASIMMIFGFYWPLAMITPAAATLMIGGAAQAAAVVAYNIATVSFRQRLCPPRLLGRMNASARFLVWGTMPLGAFLGGVLGTAIGVPATLWTAAGLGLLAIVPVTTPQLWRLRTLPEFSPGR